MADIADRASLTGWIAQAADQLGGLDILVSNASALTVGNSEEEWRRLFEIDLMGAVRSFETALPHLTEAAARTGDAAFVIISSVSAAEASALSAYGAMKASLIHVAKGMARQHAAQGVRTNVVSPGTVYFKGGVWGNIEAAGAGLLQVDDPPQPHRPHGDARGDRLRRRLPRQPALRLHHRHQHGGGRRDHDAGEFLTPTTCLPPLHGEGQTVKRSG